MAAYFAFRCGFVSGGLNAPSDTTHARCLGFMTRGIRTAQFRSACRLRPLLAPDTCALQRHRCLRGSRIAMPPSVLTSRPVCAKPSWCLDPQSISAARQAITHAARIPLRTDRVAMQPRHRFSDVRFDSDPVPDPPSASGRYPRTSAVHTLACLRRFWPPMQ
jgi:hypothetical protein